MKLTGLLTGWSLIGFIITFIGILAFSITGDDKLTIALLPSFLALFLLFCHLIDHLCSKE